MSRDKTCEDSLHSNVLKSEDKKIRILKKCFRVNSQKSSGSYSLRPPGNPLGNGLCHDTSLRWKCGVGWSVIILIVSITVAGLSWSNFLEERVYSLVALYEGGIVYKMWSAPPVPTIISIYPFNYTNIDQMYDGTEVPNVVELGPYVFRERVTKTKVTLIGNNTVKYRENRTHEFAPELSSGSLSDIVVAPNLAMIAGFAREKAHTIELMFLQGLSIVSHPFLTVPVRDFVWGYGDLLSDFLTTFSGDIKKFGVLSNRMGLSRDEVELSTGEAGGLGLIRRFAGRERIGVYRGTCDEISGTDGSMFPREYLTPNSTIYVYAKDLCRRLPMVYQHEILTEDELPAYRYVLPTDVFDRNKNSCFCSGGSCPPNGTFNTAPCNYGVPVVISYPHFTHADKALLERVTGLTPNPTGYQTVVDVSKFGVTLAGVSRLQIGLLLRNPSILPSPLNKCVDKDTVLPIAWLELKMDRLPDLLKTIVYHLSYTMETVYVVLKYLSLVFIVVSLFSLWRLLCNTEDCLHHAKEDSFVIQSKL